MKYTKSQKHVLAELMERQQLELTALDLGASGATYEPFEHLLTRMNLVEVDPDARDFEERLVDALSYTSVREAIIESDTECSAKVHLTDFPHCSSTLEPHHENLSHFPYSDWFKVKSLGEVPATSLNRLADRLGVSFHWIKLDTQGTELRILRSMRAELLGQLLVVDVELGVNEHYRGQDIVSGFHDFMLSNGFRLKEALSAQSRPRIRKADFDSLKTNEVNETELFNWPTAFEWRYIRVLSTDAEFLSDEPRALRLWIANYALGDFAHAYSLARRMKECGCNVQVADSLCSLAESRLVEASREKRKLWRRVARRLSSHLGF
jgi:hypothetical protein